MPIAPNADFARRTVAPSGGIGYSSVAGSANPSLRGKILLSLLATETKPELNLEVDRC